MTIDLGGRLAAAGLLHIDGGGCCWVRCRMPLSHATWRRSERKGAHREDDLRA